MTTEPNDTLELSPVEALVLSILAIAESPASHTEIARMAASAGVIDNRKSVSAAALKSVISELARDELIEQRGGRWSLDPILKEPLCRAARDGGTYDEILGTIEANETRRFSSYYLHRSLPRGSVQWRRNLRRALYAGDMETAHGLLGQRRHGDYDEEPFSIYWWLDDPLDVKLFELVDANTAGAWLALVVGQRFMRGLAFDDAVSLAERLKQQHPEVRVAAAVTAQRSVAEGRPLRVPATKDLPDDDPQLLALLAASALMSGDVPSACKLYARVLTLRNIGANRTPFWLGDFADCLVPLAFLLRGTKTYTKRAQRLIGDLGGGWSGSTADDIALAYQRMECVLTGGTPGHARARSHPLATLLDAWTDFWSQRPIDVGRLDESIKQAEAAGMLWIAAELTAVRDANPDASRPGTVAVFTHRKRTLEWQRRLSVLEAIALKGGGKKAPPASHRILWRITVESDWLNLVCVQQKHGKRGWTAGRNVSHARLHKSAGAIDGMTAQDQRIAACLGRETGWYSRVDFEWPFERTMVALAGHPHIIDDSGNPVTVTKRRPALTLKQTKKGLKLAMDPPWDGHKTRVTELDERRYEVIQFDKTAAEMGEALGGGVTIPSAEKKRIGTLLEAMSTSLDVADDAGAVDAEEVPPDSRLVVTLRPAGNGLHASLGVFPLGTEGPSCIAGRGSSNVTATVDGKLRRTKRDLDDERARVQALSRSAPALFEHDEFGESNVGDGGVVTLDGTEGALELLVQLQPVEDVVVRWPEGQHLRLRKAADHSNVAIGVRKAGDWFAVSGHLQLEADKVAGFEDRVVQMRDLLAAVRDTDKPWIQLGDGEFVALSNQLRRHLAALSRATVDQRGKTRVHKLASPALQSLVESGTGLEGGAALRSWRKTLSEMPTDVPVPSTLAAELRPYQRDGLTWLARLASIQAGACLADDMGLGKTIQVLALLIRRAADGPAVVVAPTSVCGTWLEQAWRFAPTLKVHRFGGGDRAAMLANLGPGDVLVASYGLLTSEVDRFAEITWSTAILDEAQAIKNSATQRHKAACRLQARMRIATTGTPIENHLGELWALFSFLNPGMLGGARVFNRRFADPIANGNRSAATDLRSLVRPWILRRTKSAVLEELPPRTDIIISVDMSAEETALYEAIRRDAVGRLGSTDGQIEPIAVFAALTRLRLACCNPRLAMPDVDPKDLPASSKLAALDEIVEGLSDGGHRALVFSQFVRHLTVVREHLDSRGVDYLYLDGSTPAKARDKLVARFQAGEGRLFLISLKAGGTGLNLTGADYVVHLDPWWNPAVEDQASDRAHRIGQSRPVTVYRIVAKGTIEERIVALHRDKRDLADRLLADADTAAKLSPRELLALIAEADVSSGGA